MANTTLQVDIVTPFAAAWSGEAAQIVLPCWNGEVGVLPEHDQLLALVRPGTATIYTATGNHIFVFNGGFAEIGPDRVTVLTEACIPIDQVDKKQAQLDLEAAEPEMMNVNAHSAAARSVVQRVEFAQARLNA